MSEEADEIIWVITQEDVPKSRGVYADAGGVYGEPEDYPTAPSEKSFGFVPFNSEELQKRMQGFLRAVGDMFVQVERQNSQMQLDEVELSLEIDGEGRIGLYGMAEAAARSQGAIRLKFKRKGT